MKILSSSTNQKIELSDKKITIYNCGPTVYNYVHIGNVRPLIVFDVLHRYLLSIGKEVMYIQNITDVDDKIINAAAEQKISEKELAGKYTKAYKDLFGLLNVKELIMPTVSENIQAIIDYIAKLVEKGAGYVVDGDVYFDVGKISNYGHVSHQNIEQLLDGVRKENKTNKKNPLDFVLWKKTDKGINWQSPWSVGRPGWHTECCVLINKYAGDHVTIHGGGVDLKFPHHENENAQNLAMCGRDIADIWMHVGHINVDGAKMSKSLGNFILVSDLITPENANGLRWFFYKAKYEQPINYTKEVFEKSIQEVDSIVYNLSIARTHIMANGTFNKTRKALDAKFAECLDDDLNLPNAITVVLDQMKVLNTLVRSKKFNEANDMWCVVAHELDILGIVYERFAHDENEAMIKSWKQALDNKDYKNADALRAELAKRKLL